MLYVARAAVARCAHKTGLIARASGAAPCRGHARFAHAPRRKRPRAPLPRHNDVRPVRAHGEPAHASRYRAMTMRAASASRLKRCSANIVLP
jgi:hypothetical protein